MILETFKVGPPGSDLKCNCSIMQMVGLRK
jgi:hypothetical protein